MSHDVIDLEVEERASSTETLTFRHADRLVKGTRIAAAAAALLFLAALSVGAPALLTIVLLAVVGAAAASALDVQRRLPLRPERIEVAAEGLTLVRGSRPRTIEWSDIIIVNHELARGRIVVLAQDARSAHLDADLDVRALLGAATLHIDDSRRAEPAAPLDRAPRPASFRRVPWAEGAALSMLGIGILLGLTVAPALFAVAVLALPGLIWCWLREPHRVIVDDSAVRIVRRFTRDVIPIRAIRDCAFVVHGRLPGLSVIVHHRERGPIVLRGFGAQALPMFDTVMAALRLHREQQSGMATGSARSTVRTPVARSARFNAAVLVGTLVIATWLTLLTGVPLRTAVRHGNDLVLRVALLLGAPRNSADADGRTALHHAAITNDAEMVRRLIRSGASVETRADAQFTPLHSAAAAGSVAAARALIEAGAQVNVRNADGRTPLAQALAGDVTHDVALATVLLDAGSAPNAPDNDGRTAVHHAALNGHAPWIPLLAGAGANLNARDTANSTPLHLATHGHHADAVEALLDARANVNMRGPAGRTAIAAAADDARTPPALVDALLDARARVDIADDNGWNAVQLAAAINNAPILEHFARRRLPVDATTGEHPPALHIAIRRHNVDAVRALLRGRASPSRPFNGQSAYNVARVTGNPTIWALVRMR